MLRNFFRFLTRFSPLCKNLYYFFKRNKKKKFGICPIFCFIKKKKNLLIIYSTGKLHDIYRSISQIYIRECFTMERKKNINCIFYIIERPYPMRLVFGTLELNSGRHFISLHFTHFVAHFDKFRNCH